MLKRFCLVPLTTDVERVAERSCDNRVELKNEVLFLGDMIIALLHMLCNPGSEGVANNRVDYVGEPLAGQPVNILVFGQVRANRRTLLAFSEDVVDREPLVHWFVELPNAISFQVYRYVSMLNPKTPNPRRER